MIVFLRSMRIVSLIASSTEIVSALGFEKDLVGRSHECDFPPGVKRLPVCTEPKFATDGTSYQIDQRVKAILQEGLSVYRVKADLLRELLPDLIVTQSQCEVCAVSLKDVEQAVCEVLPSRPRIVSLEPNALDDVWRDIARVAEALETPAVGAELVRSLQARMAQIGARARAAGSPPTVACVEWIEPLMAAGNWMPELVEYAGGRNLFGETGKHAPWMTFQQLLERDPDVIVVLPCGYDLKKTRQEMGSVDWSPLRGRIVLADGNQFFNRPGPRLAESLEIMAEILHPDVFDFGHRGRDWEPY